jgi:hypothetical protein
MFLVNPVVDLSPEAVYLRDIILGDIPLSYLRLTFFAANGSEILSIK